MLLITFCRLSRLTGKYGPSHRGILMDQWRSDTTTRSILAVSLRLKNCVSVSPPSIIVNTIMKPPHLQRKQLFASQKNFSGLIKFLLLSLLASLDVHRI